MDSIKLNLAARPSAEAALKNLDDKRILLKQAQLATEFLSKYPMDLAKSEFDGAISVLRSEVLLLAHAEGYDIGKYNIILSTDEDGINVALAPAKKVE